MFLSCSPLEVVMERVLRRLLILSILSGLLAPELFAVDYVVVFDESSTARIYDANTLQLLGSPMVGPNGLRAFGIPDPANPSVLLKIYVVTRDSVVILSPSPPFSVLATRSHGQPAGQRPEGHAHT